MQLKGTWSNLKKKKVGNHNTRAQITGIKNKNVGVQQSQKKKKKSSDLLQTLSLRERKSQMWRQNQKIRVSGARAKQAQWFLLLALHLWSARWREADTSLPPFSVSLSLRGRKRHQFPVHRLPDNSQLLCHWLRIKGFEHRARAHYHTGGGWQTDGRTA